MNVPFLWLVVICYQHVLVIRARAVTEAFPRAVVTKYHVLQAPGTCPITVLKVSNQGAGRVGSFWGLSDNPFHTSS